MRCGLAALGAIEAGTVAGRQGGVARIRTGRSYTPMRDAAAQRCAGAAFLYHQPGRSDAADLRETGVDGACLSDSGVGASIPHLKVEIWAPMGGEKSLKRVLFGTPQNDMFEWRCLRLMKRRKARDNMLCMRRGCSASRAA